MQIRYNPMAADFAARAYDVYRHFQLEEPFHRTPFGSIVVTRYADVKALLQHPSTRSVALSDTFTIRSGLVEGEAGKLETLQRSLRDFLFFINGEKHRDLRRIFNSLMSADKIENAKNYFLETLQDKERFLSEADQIEVQRDLAVPIAMSFAAGLIGLPREDIPWLGKMIRSLSKTIDAFVPLQEYVETEADFSRFLEYLEDLIRRRSLDPQDDLITEATRVIDMGSAEQREAIIHNLILLSLAGSVTMTDTIGNSVLALCENSSAIEQLKTHPEWAGTAGDEIFRYYSPVEFVGRKAEETITIDTGTIPKGTIFCCVIAAANRDPSVFEKPDQLIVNRKPNPHIAFGHGAHACLGARAARYEITEMLPLLVRHLGNFERMDSAPEWRRSVVFRGQETLKLQRTV